MRPNELQGIDDARHAPTPKNCPFCNSILTSYGTNESGVHIRCDTCNAKGPTSPNGSEAIHAWNTRQDGGK